ncbi:MAG: serine/threonine protein kinase, partial [Planctomycetes bacterium]|nr:serine/threonine protein kinase [Planctomycetota bacterium]
MTPERYAHVCGLFDEAQRRDPAEREAFLARASAANPSLRAEVEDFLAHDDAARRKGFMSEPTTERDSLTQSEPETALVGRRIGPYEVRQWIASGGMGSVYRAVRVDAYRQDVALKLLQRGLWTEELLRRFINERQVLASLNHPHIARLLDGGTMEDGLPYFVMEFVEGEPIDRFCDTHQLSTRERVQLFQAVCLAVHYAHERGIVHRDLKPANVLVTTDRIPKLTDFGLAKYVGARRPGASEDAGQTQVGQILGTPSYMAPEQAAGKSGEIGPLTDVYSLGAILYQLLTGRPPFKGTTYRETLEQVCSQEPVSPGRLQPRLPRDLETICLKCLQKEPAKRYATALDLADDLGRFLAGEPIRARPVTRIERLYRWCRRKPAVASLLGALALVVASGFAVVLSLWLLAEQRGVALQQEKDEVDRQR